MNARDSGPSVVRALGRYSGGFGAIHRFRWLRYLVVLMSERDDPEARITASDLVVAEDGGSTDLPARVRVAQALIDRGNALIDLDRYNDAKAITFHKLQHADQAVAACDALIASYGEDEALNVRALVAGAMLLKSQLLGEDDHKEQAVVLLDELLQLLGVPSAPKLRETLAGALLEKARMLSRLGRDEEAVHVADDLLERFSADPPTGRPWIALNALSDKARYLRVLHRLEETVAVFDELIERYGHQQVPEVRAEVASRMWSR